MKPVHYFLILFFLFQTSFIKAQCFNDNFSTPAAWTHAGTGTKVNVTAGNISINNANDGIEDRVWRQVNSFTTWRAEFDFNPISQSDAGHSIFAYTSNNLDPWFTGTWGTISHQDECGVIYSANFGGAPTLNLNAKQDLTGVAGSSTPIAMPVGATYFIRFERPNAGTLTLSAFSDPERTIHLAGSPISIIIPCTLGGLQFAQSCVGWGGAPARQLNANISNLSICPLANDALSTCEQSCQISTTATSAWTHYGSNNNVSATGDNVTYSNAIDNHEDRISRQVPSLSTWKATFDFNPISQSICTHTIFCYSSQDLDPWFDGTFGNISNQDHCAVNYASTGSTPYVKINAKQALTGVSNTNPGIPLPVGSTYFITFERLNGGLLRLSAFSDAARTTHVAGSPELVTIPCTLGNLNYLQSAVGWGGSPARTLTANINNISLCATAPDLSLTVAANPNPSTICPGTVTNISLSSDRPSTTYAWTVSNITGTVSNATSDAGTVIAQTLNGTGTLTYNVTATSIFDCVTAQSTTTADVNVSCTLPVDFISFTAVRQEEEVLLHWYTANEINIVGYEVERSIDGIHFSALPNSLVKAYSKSTVNRYSALDNNLPSSAVIYYRIKSIEINGTEKYSTIVVVNNNLKEQKLTVFPNPSSTAFTIQNNSISAGQLIITDALGRTIQTIALNETSANISFGENFEKGIYIVSVLSSSQTQHITVIKE